MVPVDGLNPRWRREALRNVPPMATWSPSMPGRQRSIASGSEAAGTTSLTGLEQRLPAAAYAELAAFHRVHGLRSPT